MSGLRSFAVPATWRTAWIDLCGRNPVNGGPDRYRSSRPRWTTGGLATSKAFGSCFRPSIPYGERVRIGLVSRRHLRCQRAGAAFDTPRWRSVTVLALAVAIACSPNDLATSEIRLADGRIVRDLLDPTGPSVVLAYSPSDCFSCGGVLNRWVQLGRENETAIRLLLTREASPEESAALAFLRLDVVGVFAREVPMVNAPSAYVFAGTTLTHVAHGVAEQRQLLRTLPESSHPPSSDSLQPPSCN